MKQRIASAMGSVPLGAHLIERYRRLRNRPLPVSPIPSLLQKVLDEQGGITLVQIGAHVGNTGNDPIYDFLHSHFHKDHSSSSLDCKAVLIEPVRHFFERLRQNYRDIVGVACENVAISESAGIREFYRLREGVNPAEHGIPAYADQLGSLLPERMTKLWDSYERNRRIRDFVLHNTVIEKVQCITFHDLIAKHNISELDLLQIDTEGYDFRILQSIDFQFIRPRFINYERVLLGADEAKCRSLLENHGYVLQDHGLDTLCTLDPEN